MALDKVSSSRRSSSRCSLGTNPSKVKQTHGRLQCQGLCGFLACCLLSEDRPEFLVCNSLRFACCPRIFDTYTRQYVSLSLKPHLCLILLIQSRFIPDLPIQVPSSALETTCPRDTHNDDIKQQRAVYHHAL